MSPKYFKRTQKKNRLTDLERARILIRDYYIKKYSRPLPNYHYSVAKTFP